MTVEEARSAIDELKAQGMTEDDLAAALYGMFVDDKIDLPQFEALAKVIGFELTEEFKNMSDEEKKSFGPDNDEEDQEGDQNGGQDGAGENGEEEKNPFEEQPHLDVDAAKQSQNKPEQDKPEEKGEEEDEEEKAKKMYGFNKW